MKIQDISVAHCTFISLSFSRATRVFLFSLGTEPSCYQILKLEKIVINMNFEMSFDFFKFLMWFRCLFIFMIIPKFT